MLLRLDKVSLAYGARALLDEASLQLEMGERVALIGRNGEGKSSLLRLLHAEIEPDRGTVWRSAGARVALLAQDIQASEPVTVRDWVARGVLPSSEGWASGHATAALLSRLQLDPEARLDQLSGGTRRRAVRQPRSLVHRPCRHSHPRARSRRAASL